MILKRRTEQNIVWGGIAGCFPVLIGWTAVTGSLAWPPVILFVTRLPLDAAALLAAVDEVQGAVRRGRRADARRRTRTGSQVGLQVILYAWATVACSLLLIPVADMGLRLHGVGARVRRLVHLRVAPPVQPGRARHRAAADARVPRVDHVPDAAVRRDRDRPAAALLICAQRKRPALPKKCGSLFVRQRVSARGRPLQARRPRRPHGSSRGRTAPRRSSRSGRRPRPAQPDAGRRRWRPRGRAGRR